MNEPGSNFAAGVFVPIERIDHVEGPALTDAELAGEGVVLGVSNAVGVPGVKEAIGLGERMADMAGEEEFPGAARLGFQDAVRQVAHIEQATPFHGDTEGVGHSRERLGGTLVGGGRGDELLLQHRGADLSGGRLRPRLEVAQDRVALVLRKCERRLAHVTPVSFASNSP